jgi:hypothetical protein
MESYKKVKNTLIYSDIDTLEYYQSFIMVLVNPFNLVPLSPIFEHSAYMFFLAFVSIFIGLITLYYSVIGDLKLRLFFAEIHWVFCMIIVFMLMSIRIDAPNGIMSFYILQLIFSLFCYWRLKREYRSRLAR